MNRASALTAGAEHLAAQALSSIGRSMPQAAARLVARFERPTSAQLYTGDVQPAEVEPPRGRARSGAGQARGLASRPPPSSVAKARTAVPYASPQAAVVKVVSAPSGAARARALLAYLGTRESEQKDAATGKPGRADILMLTERGEAVASAADREAMLQSWLPSFGALRRSRDVFHVVFSARAGTEPDRFLAAVEATLDREFASHRWVIALHDDRRHVHVHAVILARGDDGRKLDPRIGDLYRYRESLAEAAREQGIAMTATRRERQAARPYSLAQARLTERGEATVQVAARVESKRTESRQAEQKPEPQPKPLASLMEALMAARTSTEIRSAITELRGLFAEMGKLVTDQTRGSFEAARDKVLGFAVARLAQAIERETRAERAADAALREARGPLSPGGERITPREAERLQQAATRLERETRDIGTEAGRAFAAALARESRESERPREERGAADLARAALERRAADRERQADTLEQRRRAEAERDADELRRLREVARDGEKER
jgi:hypothetical protein